MARSASSFRLRALRMQLATVCCLAWVACAACNTQPPAVGDAAGSDQGSGEVTEPQNDSGDPSTVTADPVDDSASQENATNDTVTDEETKVNQTTSDANSDPAAVLRHAVFFAFKEESTEEDVQGVVDAFRALPEKIDAIIDFQWGKNNSPEGLDDGFTHCFLLTFKDEAGRAAYLPHPEHKAFGAALGPHLKDVFVIDYWAKPGESQPEKPLQHAVFFKFKPDAAEEDVQRVAQAFAELPSKIDAIKAFEWGENNSPESHDDGFTHAFLVTFDSEEGRAAYLPHEAHQAFVELLKPSLDKPRVLDFWAEQ